MGSATFRFYGPLNDFLSRSARGAEIVRAFDGHLSVKDTIEAIGPPTRRSTSSWGGNIYSC